MCVNSPDPWCISSNLWIETEHLRVHLLDVHDFPFVPSYMVAPMRTRG